MESGEAFRADNNWDECNWIRVKVVLVNFSSVQEI